MSAGQQPTPTLLVRNRRNLFARTANLSRILTVSPSEIEIQNRQNRAKEHERSSTIPHNSYHRARHDHQGLMQGLVTSDLACPQASLDG